MFCILNGKSPIYLQEGITKSSRIHTHSTRSGTLALFKPRMGTHGEKMFLFKGISLWNSLPTSVQSQQCKDIFKLEVKKHFFLVNFQKLKMQCIFLINQAGPHSFVYVVYKKKMMFFCRDG